MTATFRLETDDGRVVADRVVVAGNVLSRCIGLMFRRELPEGHGLALRPCNSIHMFFMRFPLDVLFVDGEGKVVRVVDGIRPWRATSLVRHAKAAIELPGGTARAAGVSLGTVVRMVAAAE